MPGPARPERIHPIAERFGLDGDAVLDNIMVARAHTYEQQFGEPPCWCVAMPCHRTLSGGPPLCPVQPPCRHSSTACACLALAADLLVPLAAKMAEEPFKLVIMDSVTANFRVDFSGRGELAERQQRLGQLMQRLRKVRSSGLGQ